jgi:hypothetical protein
MRKTGHKMSRLSCILVLPRLSEPVLYERFLQLLAELKLPCCADGHFQSLFSELQARIERKALLLQSLLPGLTAASSLEALSRASVMLSWSRTLETFQRIDSQAELDESAWELIDVLPVCFEPAPEDMPLSAVQRVCVRTFATRLQEALRLDAPHAFQLVAALFGACDWAALAGHRPFLPTAEPLYPYRTASVLPEAAASEQEYAVLEPCAAAQQADEEFEALTLLRQPVFQLDHAQSESVDQPSLLCAASVAANLRVENGDFENAEWKTSLALEALDAVYPPGCRLPLAPDSKTHVYYVRLRAARYCTLLHSGNIDEAYAEWDVLMARGRAYRKEIMRITQELAPKGAKPQHKSALRLVS